MALGTHVRAWFSCLGCLSNVIIYCFWWNVYLATLRSFYGCNLDCWLINGILIKGRVFPKRLFLIYLLLQIHFFFSRLFITSLARGLKHSIQPLEINQFSVSTDQPALLCDIEEKFIQLRELKAVINAGHYSWVDRKYLVTISSYTWEVVVRNAALKLGSSLYWLSLAIHIDKRVFNKFEGCFIPFYECIF